MNCRLNTSPATARSAGRQGFTMVEIAIALGVIGFAMVAIIGILPAGLEVQRDNRSETIINQDATFWMEALRSGTVNADHVLELTERIQLIDRSFDPAVTNYFRHYLLPPLPGIPLEQPFDSVSNIIGLLTWPAGGPHREVVARINAVSGAAAEKEMNPPAREISFAYLLRVVIERRNAIEPAIDPDDLALPFVAVANEQGVAIQREEHFGYPEATSLLEIRLAFLYPAIQEGRLPPRAQNYRSSLARYVTNDPPSSFYFYLRP